MSVIDTSGINFAGAISEARNAATKRQKQQDLLLLLQGVGQAGAGIGQYIGNQRADEQNQARYADARAQRDTENQYRQDQLQLQRDRLGRDAAGDQAFSRAAGSLYRNIGTVPAPDDGGVAGPPTMQQMQAQSQASNDSTDGDLGFLADPDLRPEDAQRLMTMWGQRTNMRQKERAIAAKTKAAQTFRPVMEHVFSKHPDLFDAGNALVDTLEDPESDMTVPRFESAFRALRAEKQRIEAAEASRDFTRERDTGRQDFTRERDASRNEFATGRDAANFDRRLTIQDLVANAAQQRQERGIEAAQAGRVYTQGEITKRNAVRGTTRGLTQAQKDERVLAENQIKRVKDLATTFKARAESETDRKKKSEYMSAYFDALDESLRRSDEYDALIQSQTPQATPMAPAAQPVQAPQQAPVAPVAPIAPIPQTQGQVPGGTPNVQQLDAALKQAASELGAGATKEAIKARAKQLLGR